MFWRLPASVRSLAFTPHRQYSSARTSEPLRILFCGSDNFSIASLRALVEAKRHVPELIHSIDVLHRPGKPTGRGLKTLREVPIKQVATEELKLPTHVVDTFTGWTPPAYINLVIAVSFGLLVPSRILSQAQYRGLNVHPSLLPDLHGPAPIEHAILKGRTHTGVSVQTLHPQRFDHGDMLAQTPAPGLPIPDDITAQELEAQLAQTGATMLVDVLTSHKHVPPLRDAGCYHFGPLNHAPKITKQDRFVDFSKHTVHDIVTSQRALGDPWCLLPNGRRLILHHVRDMKIDDALNRPPGLYISPSSFPHPVFVARNGGIGMVMSSTYSGHKQGHGNAKLEQMLTPGPCAYDSEGNKLISYWPTILNPRALSKLHDT